MKYLLKERMKQEERKQKKKEARREGRKAFISFYQETYGEGFQTALFMKNEEISDINSKGRKKSF